jgi:hypothetical protein
LAESGGRRNPASNPDAAGLQAVKAIVNATAAKAQGRRARRKDGKVERTGKRGIEKSPVRPGLK